MAGKNLLKGLLQPKNNPSKNGFDRSQSHKFTSKAGLILPILCEELMPNSTYEINMQHLTRTQPLNTAAYISMKENFDFVFVPYSVLWHNWQEFLDQTSDKVSALENGHSYVPTISMAELLKPLWNEWTLYRQNSSNYGRYLKDVHGYPALHNILRLLELLGYGSFNSLFDYMFDVRDDDISSGNEYLDNNFNYHVNVFSILAYNKVFVDFYKDSNWFTSTNAYTFNVDDIPCNDLASSFIESYRSLSHTSTSTLNFINALIPHYHQWYKDRFTGGLPTAQFGDISSVNSNDQIIIANNTSQSSAINLNVGVANGPTGITRQGIRDSNGNFISGSQYWHFSNLFNVMALKKAEVLQNWKIARLRAGYKTKNIDDAMYGVRPEHAPNYESVFIGSYENSIMIDEVLSTADTDNINSGAQLGAIGGKAVGSSQNGTLSYKASEWGVLMCLYHIEPIVGYDSLMLEKRNTKVEPFDYANPYIDEIGFVPQPVHELSLEFNQSSSDSFNKVYNYLPQYYDLKTAVDKVHGEFMYGRSLSDWTASRIDMQKQTIINQAGDQPSQTVFYVNPHILDTIFGVNSDEKESSDQFLSVVNFDFKAVQPMQVLGLPNF